MESAPNTSLPGHFFAPSTTKLIGLSLLSFGIYPVYWLYRYWQDMAASGHKRTVPWARVLVYPLFSYSCFKWIEDAGRENGIKSDWPAALLALGFIVFTFGWVLDYPYGAIAFINFFPITKANQLAASINRKRGVDDAADNKVTGMDVFILVFGMIYFAMTTAMSYMLPTELSQLGLGELDIN